jgi:hypothetical protein
MGAQGFTIYEVWGSRWEFLTATFSTGALSEPNLFCVGRFQKPRERSQRV